jgi:hypothetical protein
MHRSSDRAPAAHVACEKSGPRPAHRGAPHAVRSGVCVFRAAPVLVRERLRRSPPLLSFPCVTPLIAFVAPKLPESVAHRDASTVNATVHVRSSFGNFIGA